MSESESPLFVAGSILYGITNQLVPGLLMLYGVWLGLKANILWGVLLVVAFPLTPFVGLTEVLFGWTWLSPMWPFALAGGIWIVTFLLMLLVSLVAKKAEG
ncbi:hypothetical protein ACFL3S_11780 [Gemmatimonadota bacterium]